MKDKKIELFISYSSSMSEYIIIVDDNDTVLGYKDRNEIDYGRDIYRVSSLWITNSQWDILLAQRAFTKKTTPWLRWPAVAWTNAQGETYETNIIKEAEEELWLKNIKISKISKTFVRDRKFRRQQFTAVMDVSIKDLLLQESEVAQVKWFTPSEIKELFLDQPEIFVPSFKDIIDIFLRF